ncbi:DUF5798 family protein [Halobacterium litoreum]|uniref:DUF5798 family protein n=1 Tax=Halobacterium litoreum TaxID=2039234 RepID=A0ABD5NIB3_9EURY|nr:DUF5798 family protein [Halobacterium litoreum]UHH12434.1 DUF5798 family protein [Halobacterium litoreum]
MGFGSTAKKLQKVTDYAEKLYERFEKLREEVEEVEQTVEDTNATVADLERELAEQRAILDELAEERGVDVEEAVASVDVGEESDGND